MRRTDIYLTEKQYQSVKSESEHKGISFSEMFRRIIDDYLENRLCHNVYSVEKNAKDLGTNFAQKSATQNSKKRH